MIQGIILAGGYSSRAETNKMLLTHDDKFLIVHAIDGMQPFVDEIVVVTGHYHQELTRALAHLPKLRIVFNPNYPKGMFTSVQTGVRETKGDFFILPGDCPFVSQDTYRQLLSGTKDLRVPNYHGRNGHPLFLRSILRAELLAESPDSNLKVFRDRHDYEIIKTEDSRILTDIDTQADYRALHKLGKDQQHGS